MSISASDIKFYKAANNNDGAGNGGLISTAEITDNTLNNLFPNVTNTERLAGNTRYRKLFMRNENAADFVLQEAKVWIGALSLADDYFQIRLGSDTDVQTDAEGYSDWSGAGLLNASVGSGESSLDVDFGTTTGVYSGESVYIHVDDGTNEVDLQVVGTPSFLGNIATIAISGEIGQDFTQTVTVVSTQIEPGTVEPSTDSWTVTSSSGTYDESTYPVTVYNVGTVTDSFTGTFSDSSAFSVSGAQTGSIGSGDISADFLPVNGSSYYHKIDKDGWGGTYAEGDTFTYNTVHAGQGMWAKEIVPAAIASYASNVVRLDWKGESA